MRRLKRVRAAICGVLERLSCCGPRGRTGFRGERVCAPDFGEFRSTAIFAGLARDFVKTVSFDYLCFAFLYIYTLSFSPSLIITRSYVRRDQPVMDCVESQFKAVGNAKLVKNVVQMIFDRLLTDKELLADLATAEALRN